MEYYSEMARYLKFKRDIDIALWLYLEIQTNCRKQ
jgi:hypothetical protein